jgi:hypothetical protein
MRVMKKIHGLSDTLDSVWQELSMEALVYVGYSALEGENRAIMIDRDDKGKMKSLYVFKTADAAKRYASSKGSQFFHGEVKLGFLIEKLREVYDQEKGYQVRCVLTDSSGSDILYELDVLWQLLTN